jgi:hypothetical protein
MICYYSTRFTQYKRLIQLGESVTTKKVRVASSKAVISAPASLVSPIKPLVFISHDTRDATLAEMFGNLLTDASGGIVKSFRSSDKKGTTGIQFGAEWYTTIMAKIGDASDVVALLTHHSIDRPWILYEAGVAKGKLNTTVFGLAVGIPLDKASGGPFAQFQNSGDDEDSLTKLVLQLIQKNPDASPREEAVRRQVKAFRESIQAEIKNSAKTKPETQEEMNETAVAKMFEEVKVMFGELPERMRHYLRKGVLPNVRRPRIDQEMAEGLLLRERPNPMQWLIFIVVFRETLPWIYDLGMEFYRAMMSQKTLEIRRAQRNLQELMGYLENSPLISFLTESGHFNREEYHNIRSLFGLLNHYLAMPFDEILPHAQSKGDKKRGQLF